MNYIKEIADILGLDFYEEFYIEGCRNKYYLSENGLIDKHDGKQYSGILGNILIGVYKIIKTPYKPKTGERYYYVSNTGTIFDSVWSECLFDVYSYKVGNCYKTENEAKTHIDEWNYILNEDVRIDIDE